MERRCSGYDEFEGIFGPLGLYGASGRHVRGTVSSSGVSGPISGGRRSGRSRRHADAPSRRLASFGHVRSDLDARDKYLAKRQAKRRLKPFDIDVNDNASGDSEREGGNPPRVQPMPSAPLYQLPQRQVWLPTRNFSFQQRAGKLDMRAIARLDLEKIVATTDIDAIQRHLENLAFADVTIDDVQHYSDAYFLKLFQITQLTLEYLLNVQDSLVSHSESVESQCEQLLGECQQLETENDAFEAEIASLKKDIRHKQRTMATFEVMLLNASVSQRRSRTSSAAADKENAAAEANVVVDKLLGSASGAEEEEDGLVTKPVDCVVCGKKFISPEYLVRHQQRKHQSDPKSKKLKKKKKKKSKRSSSSSDSLSSDPETKSKGVKTAPLPAEVVKALEEKNDLARQLVALQGQLQTEKAARDEQSRLLEGQQSQLTAQVVGNMGKLQDILLAIEKKQEAAKQDMMQYTQETIQRLQNDAANAQLLEKKAESRAGKIQSDDEDTEATSAKKKPRDGVEWQEKQLEKMLEVFFKAQAQQQQEIDALAQENSKLVSKTKAKKRRHHAENASSSLMQMAALDAQRFGIDNGDLGRESAKEQASSVSAPVVKVALQEDKLVQTDEEEDRKPVPKRVTSTQEVQTDSMVAEAVPPAQTSPAPMKKPLHRNTVDEHAIFSKIPPPPKRAPAIEQKLAIPDPPAAASPPLTEKANPDPSDEKEQKLQHAAHMVGKVALGFLTRRKLQNPANWLICLPFAALEIALSEKELAQLRERSEKTSRELVIEVESDMTANELRLVVARGLSGSASRDEDDEEMTEPAVIDYHRVLLHHTDTREELLGDRLVHSLKNQIEVEIIPFYEAAEAHVEGVVEFHSDVTDRLRDIRRASMELAAAESSAIGVAEETQLRRLVRLQARVRGFLAKRKIEVLKIDRIVDLRIMKMRAAAASKRQQRVISVSDSGDTFSDPVVAAHCRQAHERLAVAVKSKLSLRSKDKDSRKPKDTEVSSTTRLSTEAYAQHMSVLERDQNQLPQSVQTRIKSLHKRLEHLVATEYDAEKAKANERRNDAAVKIQSAVQVAIARRRLRMLLEDRERMPLDADSDSHNELKIQERHSSSSSPPLSPLSALSSEGDVDLKGGQGSVIAESEEVLDDFDAKEIAKLADAYEDGLRASVSEEKASDSIDIGGGERMSSKTQPARLSRRSESPPLEELGQLEQKKPAAVLRRSGTAPRPAIAAGQSAVRQQEHQPPRASTPILHHLEAAEPGRSPRPKLDKEAISPFSKTPLLSRRTGPVARRGSGYDNAR